MEGLFFVVDPIWWINPVQNSSLYLAIIGGCLFGIFLWRKNKKKTPLIKPEKIQFATIDPNDPNYREKTLDSIRKYLSYRYNPHHSWAHIATDIRSYSSDVGLITMIENLENLEYSGTNPAKDEYESINRELTKKLQA